MKPAKKQSIAHPSQSGIGNEETRIAEADLDQDVASGRAATLVLALSGGGFRATLFQLGAVQCLHEKGMLPSVAQVFSVSGGSILAAFLATRWRELMDSECNFDAVVAPLREFTQSGLRERIVGKYIFSWALLPLKLSAVPWFRRSLTDHLEAEYDELFSRKTFRGCRDNATRTSDAWLHLPSFHVLCCNLKTAELCSFSESGLTIWRRNSTSEGQLPFEADLYRNDSIRLAKAVAASSAFPPAFPPVNIKRADLHDPSIEWSVLQLTDGGVFDNLGLTLPVSQAIGTAGDGSDIILVDAESHLQLGVERSFSSTLDRNMRANEVAMRNLSERTYSDWDGRFRSIEIRSQTDRGLRPQVQKLVGSVRTDLDTFSDHEVEALMAHGYEVAANALKDYATFGSRDVKTAKRPTAEHIEAANLIEPASWQRRLWMQLRTPWMVASAAMIGMYASTLLLTCLLYADFYAVARIRNAQDRFQEIANRTKEVPVVGPGVSIGVYSNAPDAPTVTGSGTLCCIVKNSSNELFGVTVGHVSPKPSDWGKDSSYVVQPGPVDGGLSKHRIGVLSRTLYFEDEPERQFDVGMFRLDRDTRWSNAIPGWGTITGVEDPVVGEHVILFGRLSGPSEFEVIGVDLEVPITGPRGGQTVRHAFVLQAPGRAKPESTDELLKEFAISLGNVQRFMAAQFDLRMPGDSGAIIINDRREIVGMLIGSGEYGRKLAIPLRRPLRLLNAKLASDNAVQE